MPGLFCSFLIAESFRSFFNLLFCFVQCFLLLILDCSMLRLFQSSNGHQFFGYIQQGMVARSRYMFFWKNARGQLGALETSEKSFCTSHCNMYSSRIYFACLVCICFWFPFWTENYHCLFHFHVLGIVKTKVYICMNVSMIISSNQSIWILLIYSGALFDMFV